jgi:dienelactone hydrolase
MSAGGAESWPFARSGRLCSKKMARSARFAEACLVALTLACRPSVAPTPVGPPPVRVPASCAPVTQPFVGTICTPGRRGRHAAVILLGGWPGGDQMRDTARELGEHGYVAASVVYFGAGAAQEHLIEIPVELAGAAIAALRARDDVDAGRVAVMGTSKGGEYALLVAASYPEVKAVIAAVPSPFAWFGLGDGGRPTGCSWSRGGKSVACVPQDRIAGEQVGAMLQSDKPVVLKAAYRRSLALADGDLRERAFFPLERIAGPVLCLAGDDDKLWDSRAHCELAMERLRARKHPFADRMLSFPAAGHLFIVARDGPESAINTVPLRDAQLSLGGTPEADATAAAEAWRQIYAFLAAALPAPGAPPR